VEREQLGLPKTHYYDAVAIAAGATPVHVLPTVFRSKGVPRGCYQLFTGKHSQIPNQVPRGFRRFDKVRTPDGREGFVWARRQTGMFTIRDIGGTMVTEITCSTLQRVESASTLIVQQHNALPPRAEARVSVRDFLGE
jgi:hypothetical protein